MYDPGHCNDPTTARQLLPAKEKKKDGNGNGDGEMGEEYKSILLSIVVLCFGEKCFSFCCHLRRKRASPLRPSSVPEGVREKKIKGFQDVEHVGRGKGGLLSSPDLSRVFIVSL